MMNKPFKVLSWGCGTQSTAIVEMAIDGMFEMPDLVIHSDTGWEREATYKIRNFYAARWRALGVNVKIIIGGNVRIDGAKPHMHIPFWTKSGGPLRRQCTRHFKIRPIRRAIREELGFDPSRPPHPDQGAVQQWFGISWDEWTRIKHSTVKFIKNRWPLIEKKLTRNDCISYLESKCLPVPVKSACVCCPYRKASEWIEIKRTEPIAWSDAIEYDETNRNALRCDSVNSEVLYIYQKGNLGQADLEEDAKRERSGKQLPLMVCESGYCFV